MNEEKEPIDVFENFLNQFKEMSLDEQLELILKQQSENYNKDKEKQ